MKCLFAVGLLAFAFSFGIADGCRCLPLSMIRPVKDCPDKYLSIVTITDVRVTNALAYHDYKLVADLTPKLKNHADMSKYHSITSRASSAACGRRLQAGKTYLLMGGLLKDGQYPGISLCGSIVEQLETIPSAEEAQKMLQRKFQERCVESVKNEPEVGH